MAIYATFDFSIKTQLAKKLLEHNSFDSIETLREMNETLCRVEDNKMVLTINGEVIQVNKAGNVPYNTENIDVDIPNDCFIKKVYTDNGIEYNLYRVTSDFKIEDVETNKELFHCSNCGRNSFGKGIRRPRSSGVKSRICASCNEVIMTTGVKDYSYKPRPAFFGSDDIYFGAEIEMEHVDNLDYDDLNSQAYDVTESSNGFAYCKYDSSIDGGFETVTHPFTLDFARNNRALQNLFTSLADNDMHAGSENNVSSCGVHIHMSRLGVTRATMFKMLTFIGNNKDFVYKLSRRESQSLVRSYCSYGNLESPSSIARIVNGHSGGHHEAVAITESTVEFRIFNSTSKYDYFMSYVEFVHCLRKFAESTDNIEDLTSENFTEFSTANNYEYLTNEITRSALSV